MQHRAHVLITLWIAAGCTYKEYNTYNEAPLGGDDAGASVGHGGAASTGQGGSAGAAGSAGSSAGSSGTEPGADCTGCVRFSVLSSRVAEYQLEFDSRRNLSNSLVLWRVRVRDYVGDVQLLAYVESGDHIDPAGGFAQEAAFTVVSLNASSGWQDVGIDLEPFEPFREPVLLEGDGSAGAAFIAGNPFDKSRIQRVGLRIQPVSQPGVFSPATVELDAVTFSAPQNLNVDFSANAGGFELVDPESATVTHVP